MRRIQCESFIVLYARLTLRALTLLCSIEISVFLFYFSIFEATKKRRERASERGERGENKQISSDKQT